MLTGHTSADVCIVGAGIAGLTTAYLLLREGHTVVVLDDGLCASGETGRTTAHLSNAVDDRYFEIERLHGEEGARICAESHSAAIDRIEAIAREEAIKCDFMRLDGFLFLAPGQSEKLLDDELAATHRAGLPVVEKLARAPLASFDTGPCLRFPRQGQFHPTRYLTGLVEAITRWGGRVFNGTHVTDVTGGPSAIVKTRTGYQVACDAIVVATNSPVNDLVEIHTKQFAYRTYAIGCAISPGSVERALYWDTLDPYHYVRTQQLENGDELLIIGGEDHKTGHASDPEERFVRLQQWSRERFPMIKSIDYRWSGQVMEPQDGVAFIGRNPMDKYNVYIATGDSGMGMTHGTIAGMLITDLVMGRKNSWADLYDPGRVTVKAVGAFIRDVASMAKGYAEQFTGGEITSTSQVLVDSGAIMRDGIHKIAVYRDDDGTIHKRSATCPHLGCIVQWNSLEKTWDCPCHGSRFTGKGEVLNGPAISNLSEVD